MKCLKEKCPYYDEHDFYASYFTCGVHSDRSFAKDSEIDCIIDDVIITYVQRIQYMESIKRELEKIKQ